MNKIAIKTETLNSITHVPGVLFGFIFIPLLIKRSWEHDTTGQIAGMFLYGLFFQATFMLSTLYHAFRSPRLKVTFRILDHISIYFFIAATYTPFVLHFMLTSTGAILLSLLWFFAVTGSFLKVFFVNRFALLSVMSYVCMGMLFLSVRKAFFANMPDEIVHLIYYGVGAYLAGVVFFVWRKWQYNHAVWHILVLTGGICHFKAIWLTVT